MDNSSKFIQLVAHDLKDYALIVNAVYDLSVQVWEVKESHFLYMYQ
jgi:hypothetical protein